MTAALAIAPSSERLAAPLRKAYAQVRFPSSLLRAWVRLRLTKTEIVTDAVVRALADRRRIELSSTDIARRAALDPSDVDGACASSGSIIWLPVRATVTTPTVAC
jgi:hypothetical protein